MEKEQAKQRIAKLKKEINHYRYQYHVLNKSEISDSALDSLKHELFKLEQEFPKFITSDSPTQRVAGKPLAGFKKVKHEKRMISLEDIFDFEELKEWSDRIKKLAPNKKIDFFSELKIDGFAVSLVYENGIFVQGSTRGSGLIGEDVTLNLKTIDAIPLNITDFAEKNKIKLPKKIELRGEVYMLKKEFDRLNEEQKKKNLPIYANARNLAAGSIRQLDPKFAASRRLSFFAYELVSDLGQQTHEEVHAILRKIGFSTVQYEKLCMTLEECEDFKDKIYKIREKLKYLIDGIVIQVNDSKLREDLGIAGKTPRGMIAYKFPAEQVTTIVKDVQIQVGRTGALTPVAVFEPVPVAGTTVSHATLHNFDEIKRLGIKIFDTVIIQKAGDIIPEVVEVLKKLRTGKEKEIIVPKTCPICGAKVIKKQNEVAIYCSNKKCFAQEMERIIHFASKKAFNIEGLGPKIIEQLINSGLIHDSADIFSMKKGDLEPLERFAEKSAQNIIDSINASRDVEFSRFIYSLGIRHVGEETAFDLANTFKSIKKLKEASLENLLEVKDIGPVVAESIYKWFLEKENKNLIEKLLDKVKIIEPKKIESKFSGKVFVLTGTLENMSRDLAKEKIRSLGGDISESVSKLTDYVVSGKEPGSKFDKAKKLGVKILSEKEFLEMIK